MPVPGFGMKSIPLSGVHPGRSYFGNAGWMLVLVLVIAGFFTGGCASQPDRKNIELFVQRAPLPMLVPSGQVLATAERRAATHEGDFVLQGVGSSMEPVYVAGTAVVVHPSAFHMLRKGMPVVYVNRQGRHVAHMLMEKVRGGWLAIGLNNPEPDDTLVTADNLVGIVRHAYVADGTVFQPEIATRIGLKAAIENAAPLALLR